MVAAFQCADGAPPPCRSARAAGAPRMSVAVLDFENRSRDTADGWLGDGLADEIAIQLGAVERLTVRSRTVVRRLAQVSTMPVPELGRSLNAAWLVNGSVQRIGPQLRVNVELLQAASGRQAWAHRFDRPANDLFLIQRDIAEAVSEAITGRLLPDERALLQRRPTRSGPAYELYLRALAQFNRPSEIGIAGVAGVLERAVSLDSAFLEAWALLSQVRMGSYWFGEDRSGQNLAAALGAAERAMALGPQRAESHRAMGYYYYWGSRDYARATAEFNAALHIRPQDAPTWDALANVARRQGRMQVSVEHRRRAAALEPLASTWVYLCETLQRMREFGELRAATDSAEAHGAEPLVVNSLRGATEFGESGVPRARPWFRSLPALFGRSLDGSVLFLPIPSEIVRRDTILWSWIDSLEKPEPASLLDVYYTLKRARAEGSGDSARARAASDSLLALWTREVALDSTDAVARSSLASALTSVGRHAEALREIDRVLADVPVSRDAFAGADAMATRAIVLVHMGRNDDAVALLERLLAMPSLITRAILRDDADWAPLRGHPGFARLTQ